MASSSSTKETRAYLRTLADAIDKQGEDERRAAMN